MACQHSTSPQLHPFQFLSDLEAARRAGGSGLRVVSQLVLNVALFVPLGMVVRHLFKRGFVVTVLLGLGVSGLIELTQLTGNWGL